MPTFWTIGHSDRTQADFLTALRLHRIDVVADARSSPFSQRVPQFNKDILQAALKRDGFDYVYLGDAIGGRPKLPEYYDDSGRALYYKMAVDPDFISGIERLETGAEKDLRIVVMCSEGRPLECHRHLLIARVLTARGHVVVHIGRDNSLLEYWPVAGRIQDNLFGEEDATWKSIRSVLPRSQQSSSSDF